MKNLNENKAEEELEEMWLSEEEMDRCIEGIKQVENGEVYNFDDVFEELCKKYGF